MFIVEKNWKIQKNTKENNHPYSHHLKTATVNLVMSEKEKQAKILNFLLVPLLFDVKI